VRAEAETLRSMHNANLHRVVESFEDAGSHGNHERNEVERIVFNDCRNIGVMTLEMDGHGYSYY
jgi:hypothetical protein